jgi:hypothetical protein
MENTPVGVPPEDLVLYPLIAIAKKFFPIAGFDPKGTAGCALKNTARARLAVPLQNEIAFGHS